MTKVRSHRTRPVTTPRLLVLSAWLTGIVAPAPAAAYRTASDLPGFDGTERVRWLQAQVPYSLEAGLPGSITEEEAETVVQAAFERWTEPDCSGLRVTFVGASEARASTGDAMISVIWLDAVEWGRLGLPADAGATTELVYEGSSDGTWYIRDADILVNRDGHPWAAGETHSDDERSLLAVLTHEAGHALGLLHTCELEGADDTLCDPDAPPSDVVMFPEYGPARWQMLSGDDVSGICFLYPATSCGPGCPDGMLCAEEGCVARCGDGTCEPGELCQADATCAPMSCEGDACDPMCDDDPTCGQVGELGDPCTDAIECDTGYCAAAGYCGLRCLAGALCPQNFTCDASRWPAECVPDGGVFGAPCRYATDCTSNLCLAGASDVPFCTRSCGPLSAPCPVGHECGEAEGRAVCRPPPAGSRGCSVTSSRGASTGRRLLAAFLLALLVAHGRRRRRGTQRTNFSRTTHLTDSKEEELCGGNGLD